MHAHQSSRRRFLQLAAVLAMLRCELELVMRQSGVAALNNVGPQFVIDRGRW